MSVYCSECGCSSDDIRANFMNECTVCALETGVLTVSRSGYFCFHQRHSHVTCQKKLMHKIFLIPDPNGVITKIVQSKIKILSSFIHLDVVSHCKVWNGMRVSKWWQKLFPVWRLILWSLFILRSVESAVVMCSYSWCVDGWDYERWSHGVRAWCLCPSALAAICVN